MKISKEMKIEINAAMKALNFGHHQKNGVDQYINKAIREGVELKGDKIDAFVIDEDLQQVYGLQLIGNEARDAIKAMQKIMKPEKFARPNESVPEHLEKCPENLKPVEQKNEIVPVLETMDSWELSNELIANHPGTRNVLIALQQTPALYVKVISDKSGKPVLRNGSETHYVEGHVMNREANYAFLYNWDSEVQELWEDEFEISALVKCTFRFTEGYEVTHTQVGCADKKFSKNLKDKDGNARCILIGDTRKAAITDGEKKCISKLGVNRDVYAGEV